jgi:site-specific DNA-methyltransferase (adenine-specific)
MTIAELCAAVETKLGKPVARSSVRSYLNINTPGVFLRTGRGTYRLVRR